MQGLERRTGERKGYSAQQTNGPVFERRLRGYGSHAHDHANRVVVAAMVIGVIGQHHGCSSMVIHEN